MSLTPQDNEWNKELLRRKKKILDEELQLKSDLGNVTSMIIFSNIFRLLRQPFKMEQHLNRRSQLRLKKKSRYFLGNKLAEEDELQSAQDENFSKKSANENKTLHMHIHPKISISKPSTELLDSYKRITSELFIKKPF